MGVDNLFNVHPGSAIVPGSVNPYGSTRLAIANQAVLLNTKLVFNL